jgi:hypothetical protein
MKNLEVRNWFSFTKENCLRSSDAKGGWFNFFNSEPDLTSSALHNKNVA